MLTQIHPKLPMRNSAATKAYYIHQLGFKELADYGDYLMLSKDQIELHFFLFAALEPKTNYGQVYIRTNNIDEIYQYFITSGVTIHPNGALVTKPWGQREFSLLDPDHNLVTFGEAL
jgi:catechol 2,3-dioxygenase-like lactoylglutathione lyase family enzyme